MLTFFDKAWVGAVVAPLSAWIASYFGIDNGAVHTVIVGVATFVLVYAVPNKSEA